MSRHGAVAVFILLIVQWASSANVAAQTTMVPSVPGTTIVPSLSVSERYDSNIFWAPKTLLAPGTKPEDFITTVTPQVNLNHVGPLMTGSLFGSGLVTKYLHNSDRDFIGWNVGGRLNLTSMAQQLSPRIISLGARGTYQSTPFTTGFGGTPGGLGTGFGSTTQGALDTGQVLNRVSRQIYTLGLVGGYQLTGVTTLTGSYNYTNISFGDQGAQSGGVNNPLFNTTGHQGSTTLSTRISARDTVGASATLSHFIQEQSNAGSGQGSFTTITETLNWSRLWTQELSTSLRGGGILKLPIGSDLPGQSVKAQFVPTVGATMTYRSFSEALREGGASEGPFDSLPAIPGSLAPGGIAVPGAYTVTANYRFTLAPSIAFGAGPLKSHVVGINALGGITPKLSGLVGANYSHNTRSAPSSTFDSVGVTVGARYLMGPVLASLTYNWLFFSNSVDQSALAAQSQYEFSKKMVMLSFSYAFTSPAFFREGISFPSSGGTGSSPSEAGSSPSEDGSGILKKE